jgi:hypothetical protein
VQLLCCTVKLYVPELGDALNRVTSVYFVAFTPDQGMFHIQTLGQLLLQHIQECSSGQQLAETRPLPPMKEFLREFIRWISDMEFDGLPDGAIASVFEGLELITCVFPSLCRDFYRFDLVKIDSHLRHRSEYATLRTYLLDSIENMAIWRPFLLNWNDDHVRAFCANEGPDYGVTGLEIMTALFGKYAVPAAPWLDPWIWQWIIEELTLAGYARQESLLRCLYTFLSFAQHIGMSDAYWSIFEGLLPILEDFLAHGDVDVRVLLSLLLLEWFPDNGYVDLPDLSAIPALEILRQTMDEIAEGDDSRYESPTLVDAVAESLKRFDLSVGNPLPAPGYFRSPPKRKAFSDESFTLYCDEEEESFPVCCEVEEEDWDLLESIQ